MAVFSARVEDSVGHPLSILPLSAVLPALNWTGTRLLGGELKWTYIGTELSVSDCCHSSLTRFLSQPATSSCVALGTMFSSLTLSKTVVILKMK